VVGPELVSLVKPTFWSISLAVVEPLEVAVTSIKACTVAAIGWAVVELAFIVEDALGIEGSAVGTMAEESHRLEH